MLLTDLTPLHSGPQGLKLLNAIGQADDRRLKFEQKSTGNSSRPSLCRSVSVQQRTLLSCLLVALFVQLDHCNYYRYLIARIPLNPAYQLLRLQAYKLLLCSCSSHGSELLVD